MFKQARSSNSRTQVSTLVAVLGSNNNCFKLRMSITATLGHALFVALCVGSMSLYGQANCSSPANAIVAENCLAGSPSSQWDISRMVRKTDLLETALVRH